MNFRLNINKSCEEEIIANVHERTSLIDEIERLIDQSNQKDTISGYLEDEICLISIQEVECFYVKDEKTYASCSDKKEYLVKRKLYELEEILPDNFEKISKSAIANWKKISKFKTQFSGAVDVVFKNGYAECVSRRCFAELRRKYDL